MQAYQKIKNNKILAQIEHFPRNPLNYYRLAQSLRVEDKAYSRAIKMYKKSLILGGGQLECYSGIVECYYALDDLVGVKKYCEKALKIYAMYKKIPHRYGYVLLQTEKFEDLYEFSNKILAEYHDELFSVLKAFAALELDRPEEAISLVDSLVNEENAVLTCSVLGAALRKIQNLEKSELLLRQCLEKNANNPSLINELIQTLTLLGQIDEVMELIQSYLKIKPDDPEMLFKLGIYDLYKGNYQEGLMGYEKRLICKSREFVVSAFKKLPNWNGSPIDGYALIVVAEQGNGDAIHFSRYIMKLKERLSSSGKIMIYVRPPLYRLFSVLFRDFQVITDGMVGMANYKVMMMSLPYYLDCDLINVPSPVKINWSDVANSHGRQIKIDRAKINIGLCWTGNKSNPMNFYRKIPHELLLEALPVGNHIIYHALHHRYDQQDEIINHSNFTMIDHADDMDDFLDAASIISKMDVVIAVDTAVAHLAGTMGVRTFLLIANSPDWRWGESGISTKWYDSMRVYRQIKPFDWSVPLELLSHDIKALCDENNTQMLKR